MRRKIIPTLLVCLGVSAAVAHEAAPTHFAMVLPSTVAPIQDFKETVIPLTELKLGIGIQSKFGTGFCVDAACRFIGTNYHVAALEELKKIKGQAVVQRYLATGPDDEGATVNEVAATSPMKYTLNRDLAIFELRHPLAKHHGAVFSLDDLQRGQEVEIYAYPKEAINPIRKLLRFDGTFRGETTTGLLAFDYELSAGKAIRPGASGGIVVDRKTNRIVGVVSAVEQHGEAVAFAVPIHSLVEFVGKVQPFLAARIFPSTNRISPVLPDLYPKFVPPTGDSLQHRTEEPYEISVLRDKAQLLADSMRNFIAVQTLAWGTGDKEPAAQGAYEVRVLDGYQRFRLYPDGKKEFQDLPFPSLNRLIVPGDEWSQLPELVGTELRLKVRQAADVVVNDRRMKVFQYYASAEDGVCPWRTVMDFVFFAVNKDVNVGCYGEVWTDQDTNIVRMSEHYELPGTWKDYHAIVTYDWLKRTDEPPRLIPVTIATQAEYKKQIYWCRGRFTDYQVFSSRVKIGPTPAGSND
jgi:hypothetical protein